MAIRMMSLLFVAAALLLAPQVARADVFEGTIVSVAEGELVLMVAEEELSFAINDETSITLDGVPIDTLDELGMGATANVSADKQDDESWLATTIMAQTAPLLSQK